MPEELLLKKITHNKHEFCLMDRLLSVFSLSGWYTCCQSNQRSGNEAIWDKLY